MSTLILLKAMIKRYALELKRYPFNSLMILGAVYAMFLVIFFGAKMFAGGTANFGQTTSGLVVAFMLWMLVLSATGDLAFLLLIEAQEGTLEQLSMTPLGFGRAMIARSIASLTFHVVNMFILLLLMMATTGQWLHVDLISVVPLVVLTIAAPLGIGFFMGGMALVFKHTQAAFQILNFGYLALMGAPIEQYPLVKLLPLAFGTHLVRKVMIDGVSIFNIPPSDLGFLLLNSAFYFGLGYLGFKLCERAARQRGLLGHY